MYGLALPPWPSSLRFEFSRDHLADTLSRDLNNDNTPPMTCKKGRFQLPVGSNPSNHNEFGVFLPSWASQSWSTSQTPYRGEHGPRPTSSSSLTNIMTIQLARLDIVRLPTQISACTSC